MYHRIIQIFLRSAAIRYCQSFDFIVFNELQRLLGEIETDNLAVLNSEIITFDFPVSKNRIFLK